MNLQIEMNISILDLLHFQLLILAGSEDPDWHVNCSIGTMNVNERLSEIRLHKVKIHNRQPVAGDTGIVIIGRNEGIRLMRCLERLCEPEFQNIPRVYVDSGSHDHSSALARQLGFAVVELEPAAGFSMARGRNTGWHYLCHMNGYIKFIQFIDGDTLLEPEWLFVAHDFLINHPMVATVSGNRSELESDRSIYNWMQDLEWKKPAGPINTCGGDAMIRLTALQATGGFRSDLICGEEPELCLRLRQRGMLSWHLQQPMTRHDAAIYSFWQWWQRSIRGGWAFTEGFFLYMNSHEDYRRRECLSIISWVILLPFLTIIGALLKIEILLLLPVAYLLRYLRVWICQQKQLSIRKSILLAFFRTIFPLPASIGMLQYIWCRLMRKGPVQLIEYKTNRLQKDES